MSSASPSEMAEIARLRRYIAILSRGGEYRAAAELLRALSIVDRRAELPADAVRRARQSLELARTTGTLREQVHGALLLGSALLSSGDAAGAIKAAELAEALADTGDAPDADAGRLFGAPGVAGLLAGMALRELGRLGEARGRLDRARKRLVACGQMGGAALALFELALLDAAIGRIDGAVVCFSFAAEFATTGGDLSTAARAHAAGLIVLAGDGRTSDVARLGPDAVAAADAAGEELLSVCALGHLADALDHLGAREEARRIAADASGRAARLCRDRAGADAPETRRRKREAIRARHRQARLAADPSEAGFHVEACFELCLSAGEEEAARGLFELMVSEAAAGRLCADLGPVLESLCGRFLAAGWDRLAAAARQALTELADASP